MFSSMSKVVNLRECTVWEIDESHINDTVANPVVFWNLPVSPMLSLVWNKLFRKQKTQHGGNRNPRSLLCCARNISTPGTPSLRLVSRSSVNKKSPGGSFWMVSLKNGILSKLRIFWRFWRIHVENRFFDTPKFNIIAPGKWVAWKTIRNPGFRSLFRGYCCRKKHWGYRYIGTSTKFWFTQRK